VAEKVLGMEGMTPSFLFFSARTLQYKISENFDQLPDAQSRVAFRNSIFTHLDKIIKASPSDKSLNQTRDRLCLCMADLAVQLMGNGEWATAVSDLTNALKSSSHAALCLLDILTFIPEECLDHKVRMTENNRITCSLTLKSFGAQIQSMLLSFLQGTGNDRSLQKRVLKCFSSWVVSGSISLHDATQHPLFQATFDACRIPELNQVP
jgi:hypothetical protein